MPVRRFGVIKPLLWLIHVHAERNRENVGVRQCQVFSPVKKSELHLWLKTQHGLRFQCFLVYWCCFPIRFWFCGNDTTNWNGNINFVLSEFMVATPGIWTWHHVGHFSPEYINIMFFFLSGDTLVLFSHWGFSLMSTLEIEPQLIEWHLAVDRPHHSPLPYHWFIFHLPLCSSTTSWIFSPRITSLINRSDCSDTPKRRLSSFGISAVLHVTHPLAITSAIKLIWCAAVKHVGMVGGEEVRRGLGCEKRD